MERTATKAVTRQCILVESTSYPHRTSKWFDYLPPLEDSMPLQVGQLVAIPFGRQQAIGIIRQLNAKSTTPPSKMKAIERVLDPTPLPTHLLQLADWLGPYYQSSQHGVWQTILPSGLTVRTRRTPIAVAPSSSSRISELNDEQAKVYEAILASDKPSLIHGITGSGKTQVYEALIETTLQAGRSALILAPEIILTRHLAERLKQRFGDQLIVAHSGMTAIQRRNIWLACLHTNKPFVYLGPRSTLFLPFQNLGLIIVDEEHDGSYKQEQAPRYLTSHVAAQLHRLTQARLVFGSATPSLTTLALVKNGNIQQLNMRERYGEAELPDIHFIEHRYRDGIISQSLLNALRDTILKGAQAIILINRRGSARRLSCDDCGETIRCNHCDTPLVLHADIGRLRCHVCGTDTFPPTQCPDCSGRELHYHGIGSKRVTEELSKLMPDARIGRLDRDIEPSDGAITIENMQHHKLDILVGTQMIAKGLDFPEVSLVGILNTDDLIAGSDWMSAERAVSLIMQAAGRAGRATRAGQVLIQTHQPDRPLFQYIQRHDWDGFAEAELRQRRQFGYPPYRWLLRASVRRTTLSAAEIKVEELAQQIHTIDPDGMRYEVLGPSAPLLARTGKWHYMQLIIKSKHRKHLVELAGRLDSDWIIDLDPAQVL